MAILALEPDDEPFIPEDKKNTAPILEVMVTIRGLKDQLDIKKYNNNKKNI